MASGHVAARTLPAVGIALPVDQGCTLSDLRAMAVAVEEAGFDVVSVGEVAGVELFSTLAAIASATTTIRILAAVVPMVSRAAALAAMGIASVADLADGRFAAGIGASSPTMARWHRHAGGRSPADVERYVTDVRTGLTGDKLAADDGGPAFRLQHPPVDVPVLVGAIGPRMLRVAGRVGDGALLSLCPTAEIADRRVAVDRGLATSAQPARRFEVVSTAIPVSIGGDDDRNRVRRYLLPYAMATSHRPGFRTVVPDIDAVATRWDAGDRSGALDQFDEAVVDAFGATTAPGAIERCVADAGAGVDTVVLNLLWPATGDLDAVGRMIKEIGVELAHERRAGAAERNDHHGDV
jgi:alkanesulfonate monooxygenase SsuD/methylene tetrahydromethanopterin reductase-like flavin-dependent oxidoreductase (luciferase family)